MASIVKRVTPHGATYQVRIRVRGFPTQTKTFDKAADARLWDADVNRITTMVLPDPKGEEELFDDFERQLNAPALPPEERDALLEGELPQDSEGRQEVFRPVINEVGDKWNMSLILYSGVLKNTEMISDDIKRRHLANVLNGWGLFTALSLYLVPLIAKHKSIKINGVTYQVLMPKSYSHNKIAHLIMLQMPSSVSRVIFSLLGTEKLEMQLTTPCLDEVNEPAIVSFYRHTLIADLKLPSWLSSAKKWLSNVDSRYLQIAFLTKLKENFYLGSLKKDEQTALANTISQNVAALSGKSGTAKNNASTKEFTRLQRRLLMQQMRLVAVERNYTQGLNDAPESEEEEAEE